MSVHALSVRNTFSRPDWVGYAGPKVVFGYRLGIYEYLHENRGKPTLRYAASGLDLEALFQLIFLVRVALAGCLNLASMLPAEVLMSGSCMKLYQWHRPQSRPCFDDIGLI